jgi:quinol monooxygenase YgiN
LCFDDLASGTALAVGLPAQRAIAQRFRAWVNCVVLNTGQPLLIYLDERTSLSPHHILPRAQRPETCRTWELMILLRSFKTIIRTKQMTIMFVRHTVSNYEVWRKAYDDFAPVQKAKGVSAQAVYQATENPNDITVTHEFASVEAAQAFLNSDELKKAMRGGGVVGAPTIWFTNKK